ncbi:hypothetical protein CSO01_25220 [Cellulomonas soli]|uniref:Uncharacterized protein n=1 Tax=Cellulomonas soli TaxID=931535 RepID=A0A512PF22_9CELL|nr:hypothetical protein CSO01_25220 [Cellulomonas soli]
MPASKIAATASANARSAARTWDHRVRSLMDPFLPWLTDTGPKEGPSWSERRRCAPRNGGKAHPGARPAREDGPPICVAKAQVNRDIEVLA